MFCGALHFIQDVGDELVFVLNMGLSTLPCRKHLLMLKRLSTLSKEAVTDNLSQKGRNQPPVCIVIIQDPCHVLRLRLIEGSLTIVGKMITDVSR